MQQDGSIQSMKITQPQNVILLKKPFTFSLQCALKANAFLKEGTPVDAAYVS
jgi:hypothetical protein